MRWFRRSAGNEIPLTGVPAVRRQKTYTAHSGYVYQYYFEGRRTVSIGHEACTEFVFAVSADRGNFLPISVIVSEGAIRHWESIKERQLSPTERYAIAKVSLFHAFDEWPGPEALQRKIRPASQAIISILEKLGIG